MRILIDMDDTMENFSESLINELNRKYGTNVKPEDLDTYDIVSKFPTLTEDEVFAPLFYEAFWETVKPVDGAVDAIRNIMDDGHEVFIVTASHPETLAIKTRYILKRYFPYIKTRQIVVAADKSIIKGDILIDDCAGNFRKWNYIGILIDAPHNRNVDENKLGVVRAKNWEDVYRDVCLFADILKR